MALGNSVDGDCRPIRVFGQIIYRCYFKPGFKVLDDLFDVAALGVYCAIFITNNAVSRRVHRLLILVRDDLVNA